MKTKNETNKMKGKSKKQPNRKGEPKLGKET